MHLSSAAKRCLRGFTLVEVLASVTIIGILVFLAIPNIISVRKDTEENMAIARAEALNMAISSYIQANGFQNAKTSWNGVSGNNNGEKDGKRYALIQPYLSYAPASLGAFMPSGYSADLPDDLAALSKVDIYRPNAANPSSLGTKIEY
ncbi:MAG: type II secretion system protein [Verrucomicrobiales bacterium]|nr:type II secretion system protein [Verrucomicrobiales bacterium]